MRINNKTSINVVHLSRNTGTHSAFQRIQRQLPTASLLFCLPTIVVFMFTTISTAAESISPELAAEIVSGKLKRALKSIDAGASAPAYLKNDINSLLSINKLVAAEYAKKIGQDVVFYARKHLKRGTLLKIEKGMIYVRITTGKASAKWPVKISSLPIAFRMKMAKTSESARDLYLAIKSLRSGEFTIAKACFDKLPGISAPLTTAADEKYGNVYSFSKACFSGDLDALKRLLKEKANPNLKITVYVRSGRTKKTEKNGSTLLIETIKKKQAAAAELLLDNGADPNTADSKGITPLMYAVAYFPKNMSVMKKLIEKNARITAKDKTGNTAFSGSIAMGRLPAFKLLLKYGVDVNATAGRGFTPLMMAVGSNNYDMFEILMESGANATIRHPQGWTVLDMNRKRMHPKIKAALDARAPQKPKRAIFPGVNIVPKR